MMCTEFQVKSASGEASLVGGWVMAGGAGADLGEAGRSQGSGGGVFRGLTHCRDKSAEQVLRSRPVPR